jgi:hypothetical protein
MTHLSRAKALLRSMAIAVLLLYSASLYSEWNPKFSVETQKYQDEYPDAIRSGLSSSFALSKLCALVGSLAGTMGSALILLNPRRGLLPMAASAPLIAIAALLNAPQSNYPSVEPIGSLLLWCATSAAWATVVTLSWSVNHLSAGASEPSAK